MIEKSAFTFDLVNLWSKKKDTILSHCRGSSQRRERADAEAPGSA
jgi:hypothetical protein